MDLVIKKIFAEHFSEWIKPKNVALHVYLKDPAFQLKHLQDPEQALTQGVDTYEELVCVRVPLKCYFSGESKHAPCVRYDDVNFWSSIDNYDR